MKTNAKLFVCLIVAVTIALVEAAFLVYNLKTSSKKEETVYVKTTQLTGWQALQMAIIKTESDFNPNAIGKSNDLGCFQITPVYVSEVNRLMDTTVFYHTDAFNVEKSLDMFNIIQNIKNPEHDIDKAIRIHNPNGDSIGYASRVLSNYRYILNIESIREVVLNY